MHRWKLVLAALNIYRKNKGLMAVRFVCLFVNIQNSICFVCYLFQFMCSITKERVGIL